MDKYIYSAADKNNIIVEVKDSGRKAIYFKIDEYLKGAIERHNALYPEDEWHMVRFKLVEKPEYEPRCDTFYNTTTGPIEHYIDIGIYMVESQVQGGER